MDHVFVDFLTGYIDLGNKIGMPVRKPYSNSSINNDLFRIAVLNHGIFEYLPLMPGAIQLKELMERYDELDQIDIQMLTSVNSFETDVMSAASEQKQAWLVNNGFIWDVNFVSTNIHKARFANGSSILIDDNPECVEPFLRAGGSAILYSGFDLKFCRDLELLIKKYI